MKNYQKKFSLNTVLWEFKVWKEVYFFTICHATMTVKCQDGLKLFRFQWKESFYSCHVSTAGHLSQWHIAYGKR